MVHAGAGSLWGLLVVVFIVVLTVSPLVDASDVVVDSSFMVDGTQLLLPEVPSKLDFEQVEGFARDNDTTTQTELRSSRFWGRLYIDGWPQPVQYFMSHFSGPPDVFEKPLLLADPPMACGQLANADEIRNKSAVVLARRGVCTFGTKARNAVRAGASAIIFINDREGLQHASGPDAHDLDVCAVMISQLEGDLLWPELESHQQQTCGGRNPTARLIPMHCSASNDAFRTGNLCEAVTKEERDFIRNDNIQGGLVKGVDGGDMEFLLAHFGSWVPTEAVEVVLPPSGKDGCSAWDTDLRGAAVLLERGNCSYLEKAAIAQEAGARVIMVANNEMALLRAGAEPRYAGLNITSTVMTITRQAGERLSKQLASSTRPVTVMFEENRGVRQEVWDELAGLLNKKQWPRHPKRAKELYNRLKDRVQAWPERVAALDLSFSQLNIRV